MMQMLDVGVVQLIVDSQQLLVLGNRNQLGRSNIACQPYCLILDLTLMACVCKL